MTGGSVAVTDLSVGFGPVTAVGDVSLSIGEGEFFTLVGPSGCGKTTLLRAIAGLEQPAGGSVTIGGTDVTTESPADRNVGIVFQNYALFPHMTVAENVAYGLRFHEPPTETAAARVTELLELVDLEGLRSRQPDQLSGGQKQRAALARALAPEPDVLLLDEPLSALDARLRKRLRVQIRSLQQDLEITTVYVTHDQAEALAISDRVAVMRDGRFEQVAAPETVYQNPASPAVAEFIGDNNLFSGRVTQDERQLSVGDDVIPLPESVGVSGGDSLTIAVRPESISIGPDRPAETASLAGTVQTVEFLGDAYRVHCEWAGQTVLAKTPADAPPEDSVDLWFQLDDIQVIPTE